MSLLSKGTTWNPQTTWNTRKETVLNHAEKLSLEQTLKRNEPHLEKGHEKSFLCSIMFEVTHARGRCVMYFIF